MIQAHKYLILVNLHKKIVAKVLKYLMKTTCNILKTLDIYKIFDDILNFNNFV